MASAGSIVIDLLMRTGSFQTDTARASKSLKQFQKDAVESAARATTALLGLAGAAAGAFLALERGAAAIGQFKDLGSIIGDTGEAIASLKTASDVSGVSMDTIAETSVKLTKALSKVDEEGEGAAKALTALGIPLKEFKDLAPVAQIEALSKALDGFADDQRATETMEALVRGGARLIPLLKELREQGGPKVIITQDQIDAADRFSDTTAKLRSQVTQLGQSVLADLLPPFQAFVDEIGEADRALSIFSVAGSAVRIFFETITVLGANVIFVFKGIGTEIGGIAAQMAALARFDLDGFNAISKAMKEDAAKARAELDRFEQRILGASDAAAALRGQRRIEDRGFDPRPRINTAGLATAAGGADDPTKKLLENRLKEQERAIRREESLLADRNRFLNLFNDQGLLSIQSYYDAQLAIIDAATSSQIAAYDKQLQALRAFQAASTKATDRADAQGKIDDILDKRSKLEQEAGAKALEIGFKREQAEKRFAQQLDATRASVLELQGNLAAAAAIRFDQQNAGLLAQAAAEGNEELKSLLATMRAATIAQAEFNSQADQSRSAFEQLANAEERIGISRLAGATTGLEALKRLGDERQRQIPIIEAEVQALEAIARASNNRGLIDQAEQARIALERLKATADPLGDTFREVFTGGATDALSDFITGTKTASEAFRAFADSVIQQISRIVAQNLAEQLFSKGGAGGGVVDFFAGLFGGGLAAGGPVRPGVPYIVGEQGSELFVPNTAGKILNNRETREMAASSIGDTTINIAVQGTVDRRTRHQIANDIAREQRSGSRLT